MSDAQELSTLSTRKRIVEGARRAFARAGYAATRVEDILLEASVSRPTFYRVFRNKDEVYAEISDQAVPQARTARERVLEGAREAFGRLGYELTRVEDILEAAAVSRPTFYRIFSSKQEAYEELDRIAVAYLQRVLSQQATSHEVSVAPEDMLELVIASYFEWRIGLRLNFDGRAAISEPPGLTHARRTLLLGHAGLDPAQGVRIASLLCAIDALASSWTTPDAATSEAIQERRTLAIQLVTCVLR